MIVKDWRIEEMCGYKPLTSLYRDFSIADAFGIEAVKDTHKRAFEFAKYDYKLLTEYVMVLNWKIWEHYENNVELATLYNDLWGETDVYAQENLKGDELSYFYRTTD